MQRTEMPEPIENQQQESVAIETPIDTPKEVAPPQPVVDDNSDAEMDAVLDRLLGVDESEPRTNSNTVSAAPDAEYDRALKALQRDGVPQDVIDAIKSDPSKVKDWGLKAAKRQADVDAFGAKVAQQSQPKEEVKNSADAEDDADPLSEFDEIFGDGAAKPIRTMAERLKKEFDSKAQAMEMQFQTFRAYQQLASQDGANAPSYEALTEKAAEIGRANPGQFDSVDQIVAAAYKQLAKPTTKRDLRDLARPTVGKSVPRPQRQVDRDDLALDILLSGGSRDEVRRVLTR